MKEVVASHANYSDFVVWDFRPLGTKDPCQEKEKAFLGISVSFTIVFTYPIQAMAC